MSSIRGALVVAAACLTLLTAACALPRTVAPSPRPAPAAASVGSAEPSGAAPGPMAGCPDQGGWSCDQQRRFAAVAAYLGPKLGAHGYLGVVFADRATGQSWSFGSTARPGWTASTVKLAIATDLLSRARAGTITLGAADRRDMDTMLNSSDETDSYGKHWVTDTVGFAGPGQRYLVAVMYQLDPLGSLADGVHTVSDVVALLFGQPVPAVVTMPLPDG